MARAIGVPGAATAEEAQRRRSVTDPPNHRIPRLRSAKSRAPRDGTRTDRAATDWPPHDRSTHDRAAARPDAAGRHAGEACCPDRPNPLGVVALCGASWAGTGVALGLAGLPPLWAGALGYLLSPVPALAILAAAQALRHDAEEAFG